jgi:hypothetical protein
MNGGNLGLTCEISHQVVTQVTTKWLKAGAFRFRLPAAANGTARAHLTYHVAALAGWL